jgi:hypothetical protein
MPKKILAIFCVLLMLLFHYGRMINYWSCEFVHFTSTTTTCDCEKQSKDANTDAQQSSSQKTTKDKSEDFFSNNKDGLVAATFVQKTISAKQHQLFRLPAGFNHKIFQPPRV